MPAEFSYALAFDRNIGWITEWEQLALRGKRVAIAGMGGVGGVHLLSLARLGIGAFHIADFDHFDLANFNRQIGATMRSLGRPKAEVLEEMARDINPELRLTRFDRGVTPDDVDTFLDGADLFVDGLDFFALPIRSLIFRRCRERCIPAVTAAPIGMGAGLLAFVPGGMSFENYFRLDGQSEERQYVRFLMGVAPHGLHRAYLVDPTRVDLAGRRGPSTVAACQLCAGMVAIMAIKLLLGRGDVKPAPYHHHFDFYRGKLAISHLRFGNAGPVQRLKVAIAERIYGRMARRATAAAPPRRIGSPIEEILDLARWTPSGDNAQPWRFRLVDAETVLVSVADNSGRSVYEYRGGEPTLLSAGMLLESMRIAATASARAVTWAYEGMANGSHRIRVRCAPSEIGPDPLLSYLTLRSVDRRPYRLRALTAVEKEALQQSLGPMLALEWHTSLQQRWRLARLSAGATGIRLRLPEAFAIHRAIIDWDKDHSRTGIPAGSIGMDRLSLLLMRWGMRDWRRMRFLNRFGACLSAALQMDYLPGLASAGFFTIRLRESAPEPGRVAALLQAGESIQRFWLTATRLGLAAHPGLATLAFALYGESSAPFSAERGMMARAERLGAAARSVLGSGTADLVFMGRIGEPHRRLPFLRSSRLPLDALLEEQGPIGGALGGEGQGTAA